MTNDMYIYIFNIIIKINSCSLS